VRLHVRQTPSGSLTGTTDIIDQAVYGIPCADLVLAGTHFSFAVPAVDGNYEGEISADGNTITGTWTQGEPRPLIFTRNVPATAASLSGQLAQIDAMVAAEFSRKPVDSVTVGVVSGNQFIWTKSYGSTDMEKHLPADKDTVYRIGSVTKMFTAVVGATDPTAGSAERHLGHGDAHPHGPRVRLREADGKSRTGARFWAAGTSPGSAICSCPISCSTRLARRPRSVPCLHTNVLCRP
jgi:hypothetical protein